MGFSSQLVWVSSGILPPAALNFEGYGLGACIIALFSHGFVYDEVIHLWQGFLPGCKHSSSTFHGLPCWGSLLLLPQPQRSCHWTGALSLPAYASLQPGTICLTHLLVLM